MVVNVGRGTTIVAGLCLAQGLSWTLAAQEDDPEFFLPDIEVIGISPIQGTGVDIDAVPSNVRTLEADQFDRVQPLNLPDLLDKALGSVSAVDVQNNPYQKNVNYRGFTSSPLLGEPQGLAIYQNGVRINEPFGDVMQWDLVPEVAIDRVELHAANPVFGLNALGGALTLGLKNGFTYQGVGAEATGGYFGRGGAQFELGGGNETTTLYMAAERHHDDGWRNRSKSDISRLYLNLTHETESAVFSLDFGRGDNSLNGNGPAPVELLESNRRAVFTWPDITDNDLLFGTFSGSYDVADSISFQANAYFRRVIRKTFNGDEVEAANCDAAQINGGAPLGDAALAAFSATGGAANAAGGAGFICQEEDTPEFVISQDGDLIPSFGTFYGAGNVSSTMTKGYGFGVQAMIDESLLDTDNQLVVGGSLDYGLTRFHTEQFLAKLTLDRTLDFSSLQPILNVASFEAAVGGGGDGLAANNQTIPTNLKARNRYYGVFVSDTLNVDENLALTLGGRFNIARIRLTDQFDTAGISFIRPGSTVDGSHRFARFNPAAGLSLKFPDAQTTFYLGYAEANRAPSPAELTCADPADPCRVPNAFLSDPPLQQVVSKTVETGLRGRMPLAWPEGASPVDWNLGLFTAENNNDIIFVSAGVGLGAGFFQNVDKTRRRGVEAGLRGRIGPVGWSADYSFIQSTYESFFTVASQNHPQAVGGQIAVEPGDDVPGVPQHSFKLGLDVEVLRGWILGTNVIAQSGVYLRGDEGNLLRRTSGHTIVNLQTAYAIDEGFELFGRIDNLFDTAYETFGVLGETGNEIPIFELPGGITDPSFLSPGQPFGAFLGVRIRLN